MRDMLRTLAARGPVVGFLSTGLNCERSHGGARVDAAPSEGVKFSARPARAARSSARAEPVSGSFSLHRCALLRFVRSALSILRRMPTGFSQNMSSSWHTRHFDAIGAAGLLNVASDAAGWDDG